MFTTLCVSQCSITPCVLHVTWQLSCFTCHLSPNTCHMSQVFRCFFWGGGPKIGASNWLRVFHPLGTYRLVLIRTTNMVYCDSIDSVENLKLLHILDFQRYQAFTALRFAHLKFHTFAITQSQTGRARELKFWENVHRTICVMCRVSCITCNLSPVTCHM